MTLIKIKPTLLITILCLGVLECISGCGGSPPAKPFHSDRTFAETTIAAHTAFQQGRIDEAATLYKLALKRAHALDQPSSIGDAAYNLAACMIQLRKYDRAKTLLTEAHHELARIDSPLADILLLHSEILNELNPAPNDQVVESINKVRARANVPLYVAGGWTKETFRDEIQDERNRELWGEGHSWFDYVRKGMFVDRMKAAGFDHVTEKFNLMPVPKQETDNNPNLLPQNPGWAD